MAGDLDELRIFQQWIAAFDVPSYMRRAKAVEAAWEHLLERCHRQREEWLEMPRLRLGLLFALAGNAAALQPFVSTETLKVLASLHEEWQPRLRMPVPPGSSPSQLEHALRQLQATFARFNKRWERFLNEIDLDEINRLREGYNRYYVMEKECAVRSAQVARQGFRALPMATVDDLRQEFPLLPGW